MAQYLLSLYVITQSLTLQDLSIILGKQGSSASHDMSAPHPGSTSKPGRVWKSTIWKCESPLAEDAILEDHLKWLEGELPTLNLRDPRLPADCRFVVDIAMLDDPGQNTMQLAPHWLEMMGEQQLELRISSYSFDL
jgi:hypothetical protein